MYRDLLHEPVTFRTPWQDETVSQRLADLIGCRGERVAYVYETPDTSTFRYRVFNPIEAMRAATGHGICVSWFSGSEISALRPYISQLSTIVLVRVRISQDVSDLIAAARLHGVRLLMDCDDLVFDLRYAQLVTVNNDGRFDDPEYLDRWYAYVGRIQAVAQLCDGAIATNPFIAEKLAQVCQGPVAIIPNFLNRRQQAVSDKLLAAKERRAFVGDGRTTIGYFSGTPTHNKDFRLALDSLMQLMDEDDAVSVRIVGFLEGHSALNRFGPRIDKIRLQDWLNLQVKVAETDISIAPLQINDFTNCKSELKFFEAAITGTYTVASRNYTFERAITSPEHGLVIDNGGWYDALKASVARVRETVSYASTARWVAETVEARYGWHRNTDAIVAALRR